MKTLSAEAILTGAKPPWIKNEIWPAEASAMVAEIRLRGCKTAVEIGVSSGYSSAVIWAALSEVTEAPRLYAYDILHRCKFDRNRHIGEAFLEIHGKQPGYVLTAGAISADISNLDEAIDFLFIDANHMAPWPTLDLMAMWHYLSPTAVIALHDVGLILMNKMPKNLNGARDLFRSWAGDKQLYFNEWEGERNVHPCLGVLENISETLAGESIAAALMMDWDIFPEPHQIAQYASIAGRFSSAVATAIKNSLDLRRMGQF